jgi:DNA replication protein
MYSHSCATHAADRSERDVKQRIATSYHRVLHVIHEVDEAVRAIRECPKPCGDGKVMISPPSGKPRLVACPVVSDCCAYGSGVDAELERYLVRLMAGAGIPSRHLDNFGGHSDTAAVIGAGKWEARGFLLLTGKPGVGKSFGAAYAVYKYLRSRIAKWLDASTWRAADEAAADILWSTTKEIADDKLTAGRARTAGLLVMDDLGKEEALKKPTSDVCDIVSTRYDRKLPTVITTELTLDDIEARYGRYIFERIAEDSRFGGRVIDGGDASIRAEIGARRQ